MDTTKNQANFISNDVRIYNCDSYAREVEFWLQAKRVVWILRRYTFTLNSDWKLCLLDSRKLWRIWPIDGWENSQYSNRKWAGMADNGHRRPTTTSRIGLIEKTKKARFHLFFSNTMRCVNSETIIKVKKLVGEIFPTTNEVDVNEILMNKLISIARKVWIQFFIPCYLMAHRLCG